MTFNELKKKYDELNDFSNSQLKKTLIENEKLKAENEELKGYKKVIDSLKAEGFDTVMFLKEELARYRNYRIKVAEGEIK